MALKWTRRAQGDLVRLHAFLASVNPHAATNVMQRLVAAPLRLLSHPRLGEQLEEFQPREVRQIIVGPYEVRYEVEASMIVVLRIWHGRENR